MPQEQDVCVFVCECDSSFDRSVRTIPSPNVSVFCLNLVPDPVPQSSVDRVAEFFAEDSHVVHRFTTNQNDKRFRA